MNLKDLIFVLGNLQVYTLRPMSFFGPTISKKQEFYWASPIAPQGVGPFLTVYETVSHYEGVISNKAPILTSNTPATTNLIQIDFKTRKRIPTLRLL